MTYLIISNLAFLLGVITLMTARWISGPAPGDRKYVFLTLIRIGAWLLTFGGLYAGLSGGEFRWSIAWLAFVFSGGLPGVSTVWLATLAVIIAMAYARHVATQQYAMLALLGAAGNGCPQLTPPSHPEM